MSRLFQSGLAVLQHVLFRLYSLFRSNSVQIFGVIAAAAFRLYKVFAVISKLIFPFLKKISCYTIAFSSCLAKSPGQELN